jgi:Uma2 family endonuclease
LCNQISKNLQLTQERKMAEVIDTLELEAPKTGRVSSAAGKTVPLEQRTDVTVDELERMSLPYPAELYDGKVVYKMANPEHGKIQAKIAAKFDRYLEENLVGDVMTETNFKLWPDRPKESRIPDVAFVRKGRMPEDWRRFPPIAPDLAIEIVSPGDDFFEVMDKVDAYLEQGAQIVWLVMSKKREVLVCTSAGIHKVRDVLTASDLLPEFELPVSKIFEGIPVQENS